mmetsp:Transcript_16661/g.31165  ORF Transcript_16661/g.31165 Transcript_16661/m.31165 type:complete len:291 (+) Transcript_16661:2049-2921(+)
MAARNSHVVLIAADVIAVALNYAGARLVGTLIAEDGDVNPGGGVPPGVVVPLLGTLIAVPISVGVLSSRPLIVPSHALVGSIQALVALCVLAAVVVILVFMHTEAAGLHSVGDSRVNIVGDGVRGGIVGVAGDAVAGRRDVGVRAPRLGAYLCSSIGGVRAPLTLAPRPEVVNLGVGSILAHVLDDDLAVDFGVGSTAMLVGPLDRKDGALVVVNLLVLGECTERGNAIFILDNFVTHGPRASITSGCIVLTIEETVTVVSVGVPLAVPVVGSAGVVHVDISIRETNNGR